MLKKHLGFLLNIIALGLFFPGILLTMFRLNMELAADLSGSTLTSTLINKDLSIIAMIEELWHDQRFFVTILISVFSVCIPILKTLLLSVAYFTKQVNIEYKIVNFVSLIGKWSMADVFVVAVFLAILSTNHGDTSNIQQFSIFGFKIALEISTQTLSAAGQGFYFFTAYCLISLLGTQLSMSYLKHNQFNGTATQLLKKG